MPADVSSQAIQKPNEINADNINQSAQENLACSNCGVSLNGQFCHQCGQSSRSMIKFFGEVLMELIENLFGYDSRLKRSIFPLLFQPGKLTLEYIKGRRFHYVMPFKFYLFTSLFLILVLQFKTNSSDIIQENSRSNKQAVTTEVKSEFSPKTKMKVKDGLQANNDVDEDYIGKFVDSMVEKSQKWKNNPKPLIDKFYQLMPYMMFILLPIFALFLKAFYAFSDRYYVEHIIFALHNHCFIYVAILMEFGLEFLKSLVVSNESSVSQFLLSLLSSLSTLLWLWIVVYIFIAMKRVYKQSWGITITKTLFLGMIYSTLSLTGLVVTLVFGVYQA